MEYLAFDENFENMLQLKRLGLYLDEILNRKWQLSYRNNDIYIFGGQTVQHSRIHSADH